MSKRQTGKLIYIAGPYTYPDPVRNTHRVIKIADDLIDNGFVPYIPHLTLLWHIVSPNDPWEPRRIGLTFRVYIKDVFFREL